MDINILIIILFILLFFLWPLFNIRVILFILILILIFYKYLLCKSVNFLNTYLVVPPQIIINRAFIGPINYPFDKINGFVRSIRDIYIGFSKRIGFKIMGHHVGTTFKWGVNPFKFLPEKLINTPIIRPLRVKCIPRPDMYEDFGFRDPRECYPKGYKKKKKDTNVNGELSTLLTTILIILVILLFVLLYIGNTKYMDGEHVFQMLYDKINTMINLGKTTKVSEQINPIQNNLSQSGISMTNSLQNVVPSGLQTGLQGVVPHELQSVVPSGLQTGLQGVVPSGLQGVVPPELQSVVPSGLQTGLPGQINNA